MIITIDGVAGAGKTTLADFMAHEYQDRYSVIVVHMDDLYDGWDDPLGKPLTEKLRTITKAHMAKQSIEFNRYDWVQNEPGEILRFPPSDILILEGVGAGQSAIRDIVDVKIWIDLEPIVGVRRVLARDGADIENEMMAFLSLQNDHFLAEGTREAADYHLNGLN